MQVNLCAKQVPCSCRNIFKFWNRSARKNRRSVPAGTRFTAWQKLSAVVIGQSEFFDMFLPEHFGKKMVDSTRRVKFKMLYTFLH
jgi:hypothetical protein